jgi:hypothetical protein
MSTSSCEIGWGDLRNFFGCRVAAVLFAIFGVLVVFGFAGVEFDFVFATLGLHGGFFTRCDFAGVFFAAIGVLGFLGFFDFGF